jgi:hypothetical protein
VRRLLVGFGAIAAALFFPAAARADQITALQVSPASPQAGQSAAVTLQGNGTCNTLVLDWGDNSPPYTYVPKITLPFQLPATHAYANAGGYTLKINSVKGCQGTGVTKNITVAAKPATQPAIGGIVDLCKYVDCGGSLGSKGGFDPNLGIPLTISPQIDYFGYSNFTPGGEVTLVGSGFGNSPGTLVMLGYGPPSNPFKLPEQNVPGILSWKNTLIVASLPNNITGAADQPIAFYVVTAGKLKSKLSLTVPFTATREVRKIPYGDPAVSVVSCGTDSNLDQCNGWSDTDDSGPYPDLSYWGSTLAGNHMNCWGCIGDDAGSDVYQIKFGNGWSLDQVFFTAVPSDPGEASAELVTSLPPGSSAWQPSISWVVTPNDFIHYTMDVYAVGPRGVPYH